MAALLSNTVLFNFLSIETPNEPRITVSEAYLIGSSRVAVEMVWEAGEVNSDLDFYEVVVGGVTSFVQDTSSVTIIEGGMAPASLIEAQVTAVNQCGQRSTPGRITLNAPS